MKRGRSEYSRRLGSLIFSIKHLQQAAGCLGLACSQGTSRQMCLPPVNQSNMLTFSWQRGVHLFMKIKWTRNSICHPFYFCNVINILFKSKIQLNVVLDFDWTVKSALYKTFLGGKGWKMRACQKEMLCTYKLGMCIKEVNRVKFFKQVLLPSSGRRCVERRDHQNHILWPGAHAQRQRLRSSPSDGLPDSQPYLTSRTQRVNEKVEWKKSNTYLKGDLLWPLTKSWFCFRIC